MRRRLLAIGVPALAVALLLAAAAMTGNLRVAQLVRELAPAPAEVVAPGAVPGPVPPGGGPGSGPAQGADPIGAVLDILQRAKIIADLSVRPAAVSPPQRRILHFLDRRSVPKEDFCRVVAAGADKPMQQRELDLKYQYFLLRLNSLQAEQRSLLRLLARQHGLKSVYVEGLTKETSDAWTATIENLKQRAVQIEKLRTDQAEREKSLGVAMLDVIAPSQWPDWFVVEQLRLRQQIDENQRELIELGAVGREIVRGNLGNALPLEEEETLNAALQEMKDGEFRVDGAANDSREQAMVRRLLADPAPVVVVVLSGKHDLGKWLLGPEHRGIEYIRITLRSYEDVAKDLAADDWSYKRLKPPERRKKP